MPTVNDLRTKDLKLALDGTTITEVDALIYFNAALRDLAMVARIPASSTIAIPAAGTKTVALPTMAILRDIEIVNTVNGYVYKLEDLADKYGITIYENTSIDWLGNPPLSEILNDITGNFIVRYYKIPTVLTADANTPEVSVMYGHDALVHYAAREYYEADDEPGLAEKANRRYIFAKGQLDEYTKTRSLGSPSPKRSNTAPPWARTMR